MLHILQFPASPPHRIHARLPRHHLRGLPDLLLGEGGIIDHKCVQVPVLVGIVIFREGAYPDSVALEDADELLVGAGDVEVEQEMQAGIRLGDGRVRSHWAFFDAVHQEIALFPVIVAHAIDVFFKMPLADKARQRHLGERGHRAGIEG